MSVVYVRKDEKILTMCSDFVPRHDSFGWPWSADWGMCFSIYCWLLWKLRCNVIFYVDYVDRDGVLERGSRLIDECEEAFALVMLKPNAVKQGGSLWEMPAAGLG
ncbi:hypothetical protein V6N12_065498 [Hibiscus sabdariffa]|uniref:Uncharacterized protein n=1 Tax=Hibiscus sabdariffa TaxID=183260 RepID=A0ABR2G901_9ROSI